MFNYGYWLFRSGAIRQISGQSAKHWKTLSILRDQRWLVGRCSLSPIGYFSGGREVIDPASRQSSSRDHIAQQRR